MTGNVPAGVSVVEQEKRRRNRQKKKKTQRENIPELSSAIVRVVS